MRNGSVPLSNATADLNYIVCLKNLHFSIATKQLRFDASCELGAIHTVSTSVQIGF